LLCGNGCKIGGTALPGDGKLLPSALSVADLLGEFLRASLAAGLADAFSIAAENALFGLVAADAPLSAAL
jgi:hypothetical protein